MSERLPSPEHEPKTDEDLINDAILLANKRRTIISDEAARVIASQLHGGQDSPLYALSSSGAIVGGLLEEIDRDMCNDKIEPIARYWAEKLEMYVMVRVQENQVDSIEGWSDLWLGRAR